MKLLSNFSPRRCRFALLCMALAAPMSAAASASTRNGAATPALARQPLPAFSKLQLDGAFDLQLQADSSSTLELPAGRVRAWVEGETLHLMSPVGTAVASELGLSERPSVRLHHPAGQLQSIELRGSSQVQIGSLQLERLRLLLSGSGSLRVERVTASQLDLAVHGSGSLQLAQVQAQQLSLNLTGSGGVQIAALQADQLEAKLRASGDVTVRSGRALQQSWLLSGSGDVKAAGLHGQRLRLRSFGSGDAELGAVEQLQLSVYGSGDVSYGGQPALQLWLPGSGSVRARSEPGAAPTTAAQP